MSKATDIMQLTVYDVIKEKIARANEQINEIESDVIEFISNNEAIVEKNLNIDNTEEIWCFTLKNINMLRLSIKAGEVAHNLRSCLDNLACEIAFNNCGRRDRTYFPFGKSKEIFEHQIKSKCKDLPPRAIEIIQSIEPFKGGNDIMWALHDMNREDKHPGLYILSQATGFQIGTTSVLNGKLLIIGNRYGQHMVLEGYSPKFLHLTPYRPGEFLTVTPGATVHINVTPKFQVAFSDLQGLANRSMVSVLRAMQAEVVRVVGDFETAFDLS